MDTIAHASNRQQEESKSVYLDSESDVSALPRFKVGTHGSVIHSQCLVIINHQHIEKQALPAHAQSPA